MSTKTRKKFTCDCWDYDCDGEAFVVAKDQCQGREDVPRWLVEQYPLHPSSLDPSYGHCLSADNVYEGWCKWQVRTDWYGYHIDPGCPMGGYVVEVDENKTMRRGKRMGGGFPVWIVRVGEWY